MGRERLGRYSLLGPEAQRSREAGLVVCGVAGIILWGSWLALPFLFVYGLLYGARQEKASTQMHRIQPAGLPSPKRAYTPRRVFDEGAYPARTTVQVAALGRPELDGEISAVARLA
jgi:hypothetical protein